MKDSTKLNLKLSLIGGAGASLLFFTVTNYPFWAALLVGIDVGLIEFVLFWLLFDWPE